MRALLVLCFALTLFLPSGALAAKRIALLIGNDKYSAEVGPLRNPGNDVTLIARALRAIGFAESDIRIVRNAGRVGALQAIGDYADKLASAGNDAIGFFYYSGHGAANKRNSKNYLIPVGVKKLNRSLWYNSIALDDIIAQLADTAPNAAQFVIFDACRNRLNLTTKGGKGFVPVSPRRGMLIAFSTDPGETASDAGDGSGPYARALAHELRKPGLDHNDLFQNVKESVFKETGVQVPWERNGLLSRVYLSGEKHPQSAKPVAAPKPPLSEAAREWELVKHSKSSAVLKAFKSKHKDPVYQALAEERLSTLKRQEMAALVKPGKPAKPADEVKPAIGIFPAKPEAALKRKFFKPEMVRVPGGSFEMGCRKNDGNKGRCYELIHRVTIKAFEIGKYEVTIEEWDACVAGGGCNGHKPKDHGWGRGKRPVIDVSWDDAQAYVTWLSGKTGKKYRLPSEAE
ncbi:hercynine oxygenase [bacterium MnTg02]|nr:hercynine oxygenase [bacterium MnTg02]